ncbi:MAG TPA: hypothetical protein VGE32_07800 [Cellvibrio sp.]
MVEAVLIELEGWLYCELRLSKCLSGGRNTNDSAQFQFFTKLLKPGSTAKYSRVSAFQMFAVFKPALSADIKPDKNRRDIDADIPAFARPHLSACPFNQLNIFD